MDALLQWNMALFCERPTISLLDLRSYREYFPLQAIKIIEKVATIPLQYTEIARQ